MDLFQRNDMISITDEQHTDALPASCASGPFKVKRLIAQGTNHPFLPNIIRTQSSSFATANAPLGHVGYAMKNNAVVALAAAGGFGSVYEGMYYRIVPF